MRIGMLVNSVGTEQDTYSTTELARTATGLGHEVWYLGTGDFAYDPDEAIRARARRTPTDLVHDRAEFLTAVQAGETEPERLRIEDLDVLMLRNDPAEDFIERPWARSAGIIFGELAAARGVIVVNDPLGLSKALNKLYFQHFPEEIRPRTLITRDADEVRHFVGSTEGPTVLKPLQGSGGHNVFLVEPDSVTNLQQMIEAISRDGYIVAQEYLPASAHGDIRLFLMNGRPLVRDGHYAAFRRKRAAEDFRSNVNVGGEPVAAEIGETELRIAELARPKLLQDGMFLAGLDIVGDKLMEVNVFSPAGFISTRMVTGMDFAPLVIEALEHKFVVTQRYSARFSNAELAVL